MNNYRLLEEGEVISVGDEFLNEQKVWVSRTSVEPEEILHLVENGGRKLPHRRKVEYPEHTPPASPEGMKWEYRGMGRNPKTEKTYYCLYKESDYPEDVHNRIPDGLVKLHYFEAVPDLADRGPLQILSHFDTSLASKDMWPTGLEHTTTENPKESAGRKKCPMHLLSPSAMRETANALGSGAAKYGPRNYRETGVNATTYVGAILRHVTAWNDGEDLDPESGFSHIAHVSACCDILMDTLACGMMNDDRSKKPDVREFLTEKELNNLFTP